MSLKAILENNNAIEAIQIKAKSKGHDLVQVENTISVQPVSFGFFEVINMDLNHSELFERYTDYMLLQAGSFSFSYISIKITYAS